MLKLIFLLMVLITSSCAGIIYGETFRKRYSQLKEILKCITLLQSDVVYGSKPLPEALNNLKFKADEPIKHVLDMVAKRLEDGRADNVYEAFQSEFKLKENEFFLSASDKKILSDFLQSLGQCGVYGQEKIFSLVIESLKINLEESHEISKKNTKLYRYLGVCFGIITVIFFI